MNREHENLSPASEGAEQAALNGSDQFDEALLTAYVLGELDGEEHAAEREAVERQLAESEAARATAAEIRRSVDLMTAALATEPAGKLSQANHERIEASIQQVAVPPISLPLPRRKRYRRRFAAAAAASFLLGVSGWLLWPTMQAARESRRSVAARSRIERDVFNQVLRGSKGAASSGLADDSISINRSKDRAIAKGVVGEASVYKPVFDAARGGTAAAGPAKKVPQPVPYTIGKPVFETKSKKDSYSV
ncbi:MAG TPA: hypothetical protein VHB99_12425, partial [Pirellulales bacterium]|nr:hypothetical protein [Pirellulales bacterium]